MKLHENSLLQVHPHEILMPGGGGRVGLFLLRSVTCGWKCGCVYLKVADRRTPEDLDVGGVAAGELQPVSQPHYGHVAGVSLNLAADVHSVPLPGVNRHLAVDFWSILLRKKRRVSCEPQLKGGAVAGGVREAGTHSGPPDVRVARPPRWRCVPCRGTDPHPCTWRTSG